jgi:hypothetical protein
MQVSTPVIQAKYMGNIIVRTARRWSTGPQSFRSYLPIDIDKFEYYKTLLIGCNTIRDCTKFISCRTLDSCTSIRIHVTNLSNRLERGYELELQAQLGDPGHLHEYKSHAMITVHKCSQQLWPEHCHGWEE